MSTTLRRLNNGRGQFCFINTSAITLIQIEHSQLEHLATGSISTEEGCRVFLSGGADIHISRKIEDVMCDLGFNNGTTDA